MFSTGIPRGLGSFYRPSFEKIKAFVDAGRTNPRRISGSYFAEVVGDRASIIMHSTAIWTVWQGASKPPLVDTGGWGNSVTTRRVIDAVCGVNLTWLPESSVVQHQLWAGYRHGDLVPVEDSFHLDGQWVADKLSSVTVRLRNPERRKQAFALKRGVMAAVKPVFLMYEGSSHGESDVMGGMNPLSKLRDAECVEATAREVAVVYRNTYGAAGDAEDFVLWLFGAKNKYLYAAFDVWEDQIDTPADEARELIGRRYE